MAMKNGLDQTSSWLLAVALSAALFGSGYGATKWYASRHASNDASEGDEHEGSEHEGSEHEGSEHEHKADHGHDDQAGHAGESEHEHGQGHDSEGEHGHEGKAGHESKAEHEHEGKAEHEHEGKAGHEGKAEHEHEGKAEHEHEGKAEHEHEGKAEHGHAAAPGGSAHWEYKGSLGPEHWGELSDSYKLCAKGKKQSPIDIDVPATNAKLLPIKFYYKEGDAVVQHNGHTIQVDVDRGSYMEVEGERYDLKQFHFHAPSEHKIAGTPYDMEMHLVHANGEGKLAVVGVFFEEGKANRALSKLWQTLPASGEKLPEPLAINPGSLLPQRHLYYEYSGSLTTPPCSEGVTWLLLTEALPIAAKQVDEFVHQVTFNARPTQALAGRRVQKSAR